MEKKQHKQLMYQDQMARMYPEWEARIKDDDVLHHPVVRNFTFQVTDACNLACTYCYQINKGVRKMSFETAKMTIDKLISGEDGFGDYINADRSPCIIVDFIGGEPLLEIDLIDKIVDYFRTRLIELNHPWADNIRFSMCTNGVLYNTPKVQKFLQKNRDILSLSITVDGTKKLHDSCRIFPDGSPSYDLAHNAALDWMKRGNYLGSKITIAPGNITYVSECLLQMIDDGYQDINANCVYEKGWTLEHAQELYRQCKSFSDEFHNRGYDNFDYAISLLDKQWGYPKKENDDRNWCGGTGAMLAVDPDGYLYPCLRYMESSLGTQAPPLRIGNVRDGLMIKPCEKQCVACLDKISRRSQSTDECFYCPIAEGCSWCSAYNYQEFGTADKRATYICEMHKARVLATNYYWNSYYKRNGINDVEDLWVPKQWAIPIIGETEYNKLVDLVHELGGFVNENATMVKVATNQLDKLNRKNVKDNYEILRR